MAKHRVGALMAKVRFSELEVALHFVSSVGALVRSFAFVDRETGRVITYSEDYRPEDEEIPADIETNERYLAVPTKRDLDLGRELVFRFVAKNLPSDLSAVHSLFRSRGAYRRFRDLLDERGATESWHEFEAAATNQALADWCRVNGLEFHDDDPAPCVAVEPGACERRVKLHAHDSDRHLPEG